MVRPDRALETEVVLRAQGRCEYCHFPEAASELPFHLDHVIAENMVARRLQRTSRGHASPAICIGRLSDGQL